MPQAVYFAPTKVFIRLVIGVNLVKKFMHKFTLTAKGGLFYFEQVFTDDKLLLSNLLIFDNSALMFYD
jgi:hypothetical protein